LRHFKREINLKVVALLVNKLYTYFDENYMVFLTVHSLANL